MKKILNIDSLPKRLQTFWVDKRLRLLSFWSATFKDPSLGFKSRHKVGSNGINFCFSKKIAFYYGFATIVCIISLSACCNTSKDSQVAPEGNRACSEVGDGFNEDNGSYLRKERGTTKYTTGDYGFRWRNSFNFLVNGQQINTWTTNSASCFGLEQMDETHCQSDHIQQALRTVVDCAFRDVRRTDKDKFERAKRYNAAAAAITVVYKDGKTYKAYTKFLAEEGGRGDVPGATKVADQGLNNRKHLSAAKACNLVRSGNNLAIAFPAGCTWEPSCGGITLFYDDELLCGTAKSEQICNELWQMSTSELLIIAKEEGINPHDKEFYSDPASMAKRLCASKMFRLIAKANLAKFFFTGEQIDANQILCLQGGRKHDFGIAMGKWEECNIIKYNKKIRFQCSETAVLSVLFNEIGGTSFESRKKSGRLNISEIITNICETQGINEKDIEVIVLHIHSIMYPCAACATTLGAVSYAMNHLGAYPCVARFLKRERRLRLSQTKRNEGDSFVDRLETGQCKFLIECSSSAHFPYNYAYGEPTNSGDSNDKSDFRDVFHKCARTEYVGHDRFENLRINVVTDSNWPKTRGRVAQTFIPNWTLEGENFKFEQTFPPYCVFAEINGDGQIFIPHKGRCSKPVDTTIESIPCKMRGVGVVRK
ncbi:MAG: hypothetical protein LBQ43_03200 [Holosporales bacterium]|jgi:hypothetical protein|nr:hypothetical protein [Holosporales bacterium]